eukprot:g24050.t1
MCSCSYALDSLGPSRNDAASILARHASRICHRERRGLHQPEQRIAKFVVYIHPRQHLLCRQAVADHFS